MSTAQGGYFAALVVGVPVGAVIADRFGWRAAFIAFGVLAAPLIVFTRLVLPDDSRTETTPKVLYRFSNFGRLLTNKATLAAIFAASFVSLGFAGFVQYLGSWLTRRNGLGLTVSEVGLVFIALGVASLVGGIGAVYVSDKVGKRKLSIACTLLLAALLLTIPRFEIGIPLGALFVAASFIFALRQGPLHALATEVVLKEARGALVALRNTASQIGIALATIICGQLYDIYGYAAVGVFSAIATLMAAVFIIMMPEPERKVLRQDKNALI
jgi:predicted MFS family arabinose efflux permease